MAIYFYLCLIAMVLQNTIKFWAYTSCYKLKVKKWAGYLIYLSVTTAITFFSLYYQWVNGKLPPFNFMPMILFYFLPFYFLSEGNPLKKVILTVIDQVIIDALIEFLIYITAAGFGGNDLLDPSYFGYERVLCCVAFCFIAAPVKYIMVKIWNRVNKKSAEKINPLFLIFPIGQLIPYFLLQVERYYSDFDIWGMDSLVITSVYFVVLALSSVIYIIFLSDVEKKNMLEREYSTLDYTRRLEETRYAAIEEKQKETAKIRHDFKNQLIVIKSLLSAGSSDEASELFNELDNSINALSEKEYCSVPVINALLCEKEMAAEKNGVAFKCGVTVFDTGCISKMHLCSIFSNLIDNALNECSAISKDSPRDIKINASQKNGFISVSCENSVREGKESVPKPSESKGYGMKILQDIAEKYDGRYKCEIKNGRCYSAITVSAFK